MESADKDKIKNCELLNQVLKIFSSRKTTLPKISPKKSPKKAFNYLETGLKLSYFSRKYTRCLFEDFTIPFIVAAKCVKPQ